MKLDKNVLIIPLHTSQTQLQNRTLAAPLAFCSFCRIVNLYDFKRSNFFFLLLGQVT
jgi:hypothetical protein